MRPVDGCSFTFTEIVKDVLPAHMTELRSSMSAPRLMLDFAQKGVGVRTLLHQTGRDTDFPGCNVMLDSGHPFCVGISRKVFTRLRQHVLADTHKSATLVHTGWRPSGPATRCGARKPWRTLISSASSTGRERRSARSTSRM